MNEPKRWLDDGAPDAIGHMLRAAGDERPSRAALERAVAGVVVGAGISGSAVGVAGAAVKGAPLAGGVFLKWTLLGSLVTLGAGGLAAGVSSLTSERAAPARAPSSTPAEPRMQVVDSHPAAQPDQPDLAASVEPSPKAAPTPAGREPRGDGDSPRPNAVAEASPVDAEVLVQETRLVDRARAELAAGRAARTLVALDEYQARFPRPRYAPEALYLRMEALLALGNRPAARQVASRLASSHPSSPHAARAEAVLSTKIP